MDGEIRTTTTIISYYVSRNMINKFGWQVDGQKIIIINNVFC